MSKSTVVLVTLSFAWLLGIAFELLIANTGLMTFFETVLGLALGYYTVVESKRRYRLMRALTED